jgi:Aerotolerance regulator N-terminal/von Willebrand factor type A domain
VGLFAPWFLAGLAAIGLPIWIHLLRQHKQTPKKFASLMFFERRTQSSVKHRRLKHYLLLALRLAMLLLLALLFANPFINRTAPTASSRKLLLVAVDHSFSMRYGNHLERAKQEAIDTVSKLRSGDQAQVVALGSRVEILTQPSNDANALAAAIRSITPGDTASSYAEFARYLRALPQSAHMPVEGHVFSDMQKSSLPPSFNDLRLGDQASVNLHSVAESKAPNWAVETVSSPARIYGTKKARIQATIAGYGAPAGRRTVTLLLNGHTVESKSVDVGENGRAQVEFANVDTPYGFNRAEVQINGGDQLAADDRFYVSIERAEAAKALFIHDARQTPEYFRSALDAAADSAFEVEAVTAEQAANITLAKYAFIVVSALGSAPPSLESNLNSYVRNGGGVLIALGPLSAAAGRVLVTGDRVTESRYAGREGDRYENAAQVDRSYPPLSGAGSLETVKFYQAQRVEPGDARIAARLNDGTPLLYEKRIGEGRAVVLTSTLDNISNDFPLHASFVPFVERMARYLEGSEGRPDSASVGSYIELRKAKDQAVAAEVIGPDGQRALDLKQASAAQNYQVDRAGFYDVRPASGKRELVAVNVDRRESDLTPIPEETLALWRGPASPQNSSPATNNRGPEPYSLWKYFLFALLAAAVVESILADRFTSASRETPSRRPQPSELPLTGEREKATVGGVR